MAKLFLGASLITTLALVAVLPAIAAVNVSAEGEVTAIYAVPGNFTLQAGADVYAVIGTSWRSSPNSVDGGRCGCSLD